LKAQPLGRGAIVTDAGSALVLWAVAGDGTSLGFPIRPQSHVLHRGHVALSPAESRALGLRALASIIETESDLVPSRSVDVLGRCSESLLIRIASTIRRSREAASFEDRNTPIRWL
jgi:hypothetical protein